jgi:hypothetical protein
MDLLCSADDDITIFYQHFDIGWLNFTFTTYLVINYVTMKNLKQIWQSMSINNIYLDTHLNAIPRLGSDRTRYKLSKTSHSWDIF